MNDEQFEATMECLRDELADNLRARDTAQREALARVEAERDGAWRNAQRWRKAEHTAQAQLAEAVGLLLDASDPRGPNIRYAAIKDFLLRHAQAVQQEARNAEVARESLRPENQRIEPVEPLRVPHPLEAQGAQARDERAAFEEWAHKNWPGAERKMLERDEQGSYVSTIYRDYFTGWKARAALATQPAARGAEHE